MTSTGSALNRLSSINQTITTPGLPKEIWTTKVQDYLGVEDIA